ncbi:hypothetical protein [Flavitalea sp.]|nr:hypothetical protein [Flavitalea sp.]
MQPIKNEKLIKDLTYKADCWLRMSNRYAAIHWSVGCLGILSSALAASTIFHPTVTTVFSIISTICIGIIGFVNAQQKGDHFLRGFRILEPAVKKYEFSDMTEAQLLDINEKLEGSLNEATFDSPRTTSPKPSTAP